MDFKSIKKEIDVICKSRSIKDYKLVYCYSSGLSASAVNREIVGSSNAVSSVLGLTVVHDGNGGASATNSYDSQSLERLVGDAWDNALSLEGKAECIIYPGSPSYQSLPECTYTEPSMSEIVSKTMEIQNAMMDSDPRVQSGSQTMIDASKSIICFANSAGLLLEREYGYNAFIADAVIRDGDDTTTDDDYGTGAIEDMHLGSCVSEAVSKLHARKTPSRNCSVVFSPRCMCQILAAFKSVFYGKNALLGLSLLKDREGEAIASEPVTLIDDPFEPSAVAKIAFDADGVATYKKAIIENGVLKTLLYNLSSAKEANKTTTGNAGPYLGTAQTTTFSFYLAPGTATLPELLAKAGDDGIYITEMKGLHAGADASTGDFSIDSAGFEADGTPVKNLTVSGNFYQMLRDITALSSEVEFGLPSGIHRIGSPSVLVSSLSIAGK